LDKLQIFCHVEAPEAQDWQRQFKPPACRQAGSYDNMVKKMCFKRFKLIGNTS